MQSFVCWEHLKLCFPQDMNNECAMASPVWVMNSLYKTIFQIKLPYCLEALSPRSSNNEWANEQICPSNATYISHYFMCIQETAKSIYIYISYELTAMNSVTMSTAIHIFHIVGTCPWTAYMLSHCTNTVVHILLHTQSKKLKHTPKLNQYAMPIYVPATNMTLNATYIPSISCTDETTESVCIPHVNLYCCYQYCDQEHWYTYISQYWHMPLKKYAYHIAYIYPTALHL